MQLDGRRKPGRPRSASPENQERNQKNDATRRNAYQRSVITEIAILLGRSYRSISHEIAVIGGFYGFLCRHHEELLQANYNKDLLVVGAN